MDAQKLFHPTTNQIMGKIDLWISRKSTVTKSFDPDQRVWTSMDRTEQADLG